MHVVNKILKFSSTFINVIAKPISSYSRLQALTYLWIGIQLPILGPCSAVDLKKDCATTNLSAFVRSVTKISASSNRNKPRATKNSKSSRWRAGPSRDIAWTTMARSRRCNASAVRQMALLASCPIVRFIALFAQRTCTNFYLSNYFVTRLK